MNLLETLIVICFAITAHYMTEFFKIHPPYSCPTYCEVDHGHFFNGIDTTAVNSAKKKIQKVKSIFRQKFRNRLPKYGILPVTSQQHHHHEHNQRESQSDASQGRYRRNRK